MPRIHNTWHDYMSSETVLRAKRFCIDELFDSEVYARLAEIEKDARYRDMLMEFSRQEREHYEFWRKISGECIDEVSTRKIPLYLLMRKAFGLTFTLKLLERHEREVIKAYKAFIDKPMDEENRAKLIEIIKEEEVHESRHYERIDERSVKYVGSMALGLSDAIVEVTGVHAGFLGITSSTIMTGVAGLIVGISAAISMASAAYIQSKQELRKSPVLSAIYTGLAYILAVIMLASPFFLLKGMKLAFSSSILIGIALILGFSFYASVLLEKNLKREFIETSLLLFATAFITYLIGRALGVWLL